MNIRPFHIRNATHDGVKRLCTWLGIDKSTDWKQESLLNWLIYEGYVLEYPTVSRGMY